jgi:DNA-binding response OmpR family regulator
LSSSSKKPILLDEAMAMGPAIDFLFEPVCLVASYGELFLLWNPAFESFAQRSRKELKRSSFFDVFSFDMNQEAPPLLETCATKKETCSFENIVLTAPFSGCTNLKIKPIFDQHQPSDVSAFLITFKLQPPKALPAPPSTASEASPKTNHQAPSPSEPLKVLVVDDTVELNMLLCLMVNKNKSLRAQGVYSGKEAIEAIISTDYDAVVLDMMMPLMSGLETLKLIREQDEMLPVVMCTAKSDRQDIEAAFDLGADDYLIKPVSKEQLQETLTSILSARDTESEHVDQIRLRNKQTLLQKLNPSDRSIREHQLILSMKFRSLEGNSPAGPSFESKAQQLTQKGCMVRCQASDLAVGSNITFAIQNASENKVLFGGVGRITHVDLEGLGRTYKVEFLSVKKPN